MATNFRDQINRNVLLVIASIRQTIEKQGRSAIIIVESALIGEGLIKEHVIDMLKELGFIVKSAQQDRGWDTKKFYKVEHPLPEWITDLDFDIDNFDLRQYVKGHDIQSGLSGFVNRYNKALSVDVSQPEITADGDNLIVRFNDGSYVLNIRQVTKKN